MLHLDLPQRKFLMAFKRPGNVGEFPCIFSFLQIEVSVDAMVKYRNAIYLVELWLLCLHNSAGSTKVAVGGSHLAQQPLTSGHGHDTCIHFPSLSSAMTSLILQSLNQADLGILLTPK